MGKGINREQREKGFLSLPDGLKQNTFLHKGVEVVETIFKDEGPDGSEIKLAWCKAPFEKSYIKVGEENIPNPFVHMSIPFFEGWETDPAALLQIDGMRAKVRDEFDKHWKLGVGTEKGLCFCHACHDPVTRMSNQRYKSEK